MKADTLNPFLAYTQYSRQEQHCSLCVCNKLCDPFLLFLLLLLFHLILLVLLCLLSVLILLLRFSYSFCYSTYSFFSSSFISSSFPLSYSFSSSHSLSFSFSSSYSHFFLHSPYLLLSTSYSSPSLFSYSISSPPFSLSPLLHLLLFLKIFTFSSKFDSSVSADLSVPSPSIVANAFVSKLSERARIIRIV